MPTKKTKKRVNKKGKGLGDVLQKALEKSGIESHMLYSVLPPKKMSYCGPGTRLDRRLNSDGSWKEWRFKF